MLIKLPCLCVLVMLKNMLKNMIRSLQASLQGTPKKAATAQPLNHAKISDTAVSAVRRLQQKGYEAYLVGGCVRDLLVGLQPKDFDIATSATPEEVRSLFRNARIIGKRFKLVHLYFGRELLEVATFRAQHADNADTGSAHPASGRILRDNVYGCLADDIQRRDLTINALYYDPSTRRLLDHAEGMADIKAQCIRLIGDPNQRYREDPVRMLRVIRFASKLNFKIDAQTAAAIAPAHHLLKDIPPARLFEEILKLFLNGRAEDTFLQLKAHQLLTPLLPETALVLASDAEHADALIRLALRNTDQRIREQRPVTPAFLFAALLWPALAPKVTRLKEQGSPPLIALQEASQQLISLQCQSTSIPKRFTQGMREIWELQERLKKRQGKYPELLLSHPRFRAGYDFLLLREAAGEPVHALGAWWTAYQEADTQGRHALIQAATQKPESAHKKRAKRPRTGHTPTQHNSD